MFFLNFFIVEVAETLDIGLSVSVSMSISKFLSSLILLELFTLSAMM